MGGFVQDPGQRHTTSKAFVCPTQASKIKTMLSLSLLSLLPVKRIMIRDGMVWRWCSGVLRRVEVV